MAERFGSYGASPHRRAHQAELFRALFDKAERERLFAAGLPVVSGQSQRERPAPSAPIVRPPVVREPDPQWTVVEPPPQPPYGRDDFLRETYLTEPCLLYTSIQFSRLRATIGSKSLSVVSNT